MDSAVNLAPAMDKFAGLILVDPLQVEIQWVTSEQGPSHNKWQGVRCSTEQAYQLYLHLAQLFYDAGWPQAQPEKSPGRRR